MEWRALVETLKVSRTVSRLRLLWQSGRVGECGRAETSLMQELEKLALLELVDLTIPVSAIVTKEHYDARRTEQLMKLRQSEGRRTHQDRSIPEQ